MGMMSSDRPSPLVAGAILSLTGLLTLVGLLALTGLA
jgi:hypothetical protein